MLPVVSNHRGSLGMKIGVVCLALFVIFAVIIGVWWVQTSNAEIRLRNKIGAQNQVIEAFFDKMWKVLKQQAGVADQYKDSFREIYKDIMAGRYSGEGKGQMMLWIKEQNPQFDTKLFDNLMVSIESQREGFFVEQKKIIDMVKIHKDMIQTFPTSIVVFDRGFITYEVISSSVSKEVMKTREENDVNLFNKKKD